MTNFAKTIKLFLMDGDANGTLMCELSNWTGKAYRIPRSMINEKSNRNDLSNTGVYMLFGENTEGEPLVYIGETEEINRRLSEHLRKKDFWNEALVFISKDEHLNKAHIKYLEYSLYSIAKECKQYLLDNDIEPKEPSISEAEKAEMEEFIFNLKLLTNTLGYRVFNTIEHKNTDPKEVFHIKGRGVKATGRPSTRGFIVFKGSQLAIDTSKSFSMNATRDKLIDTGVVEQHGDHYVFIDNYEFTSPSSAAGIVLGRSENGREAWKRQDGISLKELEQREEAATIDETGV